MLLAYPVLIWLARRHQAWDPVHDLLCAILAGICGTGAIYWHFERIHALVTTLTAVPG